MQTSSAPPTAESPDPATAEWRDRLERIEARRQQAIRQTFQRIDAVALGAGVGVVTGLLALVAGLELTIQDLRPGGALGTLKSVLPGFDLTWVGSFLGGLYGAVAGFVVGWLTAGFRNLGLTLVLRRALWKANRWRRTMLDLV